MITLLTFPPAFGLFAASPFCVKVAYLLNMSGQTWEREDILDPRKMPYGKLPVIRVKGQLIADSDRIQAFLEGEGADFNVGLSDLDKANARAFIRMTEEHLYFHLVLERWADDAIWPKVRDRYFSQIPPGLRHVIAAGVRRKTLNGLYSQGLGRLSPQERLARIEPDIDAITVRLQHGAFLFGDQPTAADASVAPMLAAAVSSPGETLMRSMIMENETLMAYIARVDETCG